MLVLYDYWLTFGAEVDLFWNGGCSSAAVLFIANRYLTVVYYLYLIIYEFVPLSAAIPKVLSFSFRMYIIDLT